MRLLSAAAFTLGTCLAPCLLAGASAKQSAPSTEAPVRNARDFVADAEQKLEAESAFATRAAWVRATDITPDTNMLAQFANARRNELAARLAAEAAHYDPRSADPETRRKLDLLKLLVSVPAPNRPGGADALASVSNRLATAYDTASFALNGKTYVLREAENAIAKSRDPGETRNLWEGWRTVGIPMRADYAQMVEVGNEGARGLGYSDVGALWRSRYDMPPDDFAKDLARLWGQLTPLYTNLHCYVRRKLNDKYGDAVQPRSGPIRADLLGNMWGQDWSRIYDVVAPKVDRPAYDLTGALARKNYTPVSMVRSAEGFYKSLGFSPLPESFWERSQIVRPAGKKVDCNASAWEVDERDDVRIKACFEVSADHWYVAHHELGHIYASLAEAPQPFLFRGSANPGFGEAIGDFIALSSVTPSYLQKMGLQQPGEAAPDPIPGLLSNALAKVPLLAFAVGLDQWRWQVFDGSVGPDRYNSSWWTTVGTVQGLKAPGSRPADAFDAFPKYHVASNTAYSGYFMSLIYQYQFQRAACRIMGNNGPLAECSIYGSRKVGDKLRTMLALGRSKPTADYLEAFTGQREADASAMAEYYAPLEKWLVKQNQGESCGWN